MIFFKGVLPPLIITSLLVGLVVLQPDIGTGAIIFAIACSVIFSSGIKFRHLFVLISIGFTVLIALGIHMLTDEKKYHDLPEPTNHLPIQIMVDTSSFNPISR